MIDEHRTAQGGLIVMGRQKPISSNAKPERNAAIYDGFKLGDTHQELMERFQLSRVSIRKIIAVAQCAEWRAAGNDIEAHGAAYDPHKKAA